MRTIKCTSDKQMGCSHTLLHVLIDNYLFVLRVKKCFKFKQVKQLLSGSGLNYIIFNYIYIFMQVQTGL